MTPSLNRASVSGPPDASWRGLYRAGAVAALLAVGVSLAEIAITSLPGGTSEGVVSVVDWFALLQRRPWMGLRNLGLLNVAFNALAIPAFLALYAVHRRAGRSLAALAAALALVGVAVFFATNRALPMLDLSRRYAAATDEAQRATLVAAGRAMLAVGASHTPGTFTAFFLSELAGLLMSLAMLRGGVFRRANASLGLLGFALLLVFEVFVSLAGSWGLALLMLSALGGLLSMAWYALLALRLLRLARCPSQVERSTS